MWFRKQGQAFAFHDAHPDRVVIAEDISAHGHKRYGVVENVDDFQGPFCELIRIHSVCRLYFDLDGGPEHLPKADELVSSLVAEANVKMQEAFGIPAGEPLVLCSSSATKFSKHVLFPVLFKNNWQHMRGFVDTFRHPLIDQAVYSRNRCFRMAGCHKYGDPHRILVPGLPSSALVQTEGEGLEFETELVERPREGVTVGAFDVNRLRVPDGWRSSLASPEPDDLLKAIHPDQPYSAFFSIGCAYKRAGGSCDTFCDWCAGYRRRHGVSRQWRGWNRSERGYGYSFLKSLAIHSSTSDECGIHLDEAFGFHIDNVQAKHVNTAYLTPDLLSGARCVLVKSPTGSGKTTVARTLCQSFSHKRILYVVSSRALAYGARDKLNSMVKLGHKLGFVAYLETDRPLHTYQHLVISIQSMWRAFRIKKQAYALIVCDELSSIIEDMTGPTNKHPRENQQAFRWFSEQCTRWVGLDAHLMDTSLVLCQDYFTDVRVVVNHYRGARKDAVFIPPPKWTTLGTVRAKAMVPNARVKDVNAFSDATVMYDLMFDCWTQGVKTFFVCNNVRLGNWVEENYLRRSFTWMALVCAGLCDDLALVITDFTCSGSDVLQKLLKYAWVKAGDGRTGKDFRTLDWWAQLDHLQYTLRICQGMDFNPPVPHFGIGFCYTTPNTAVPRRVLQQTGRTRKLAVNPVRHALW